MRWRKIAYIKGFRGCCPCLVGTPESFFDALTIVPTTEKTEGLTIEALFALGVTRELLF